MAVDSGCSSGSSSSSSTCRFTNSTTASSTVPAAGRRAGADGGGWGGWRWLAWRRRRHVRLGNRARRGLSDHCSSQWQQLWRGAVAAFLPAPQVRRPSRKLVSGLSWPMRWLRPMAWRSKEGLSVGSHRMMWVPAVSVMPAPPALQGQAGREGGKGRRPVERSFYQCGAAALAGHATLAGTSSPAGHAPPRHWPSAAACTARPPVSEQEDLGGRVGLEVADGPAAGSCTEFGGGWQEKEA